MAYKLIKGEIHIFYPDIPHLGPEPDGDTLKFKPDNPQLVEGLQRPGSSPDFNTRNMINLRFEGIDALELHYKEMHQNLQWAVNARDELLDSVGFQNVQFIPNHIPVKVQSADNHPQRGYVLARSLDTYGRIIAFVYTGDRNEVDGSEIWLADQDVLASLNAQLLKAGLVYPAFYSTLPIDLKNVLKTQAANARTQNLGLWADRDDKKNVKVSIPDLATLQDLVFWPKMFRRLSAFFSSGHQGLGQFDTWLRADPVHRDDRLILPNREYGNMHDLFEVSGDDFRLLHEPEELIVLPDDAVTGPVVVPLPKPTENLRIIAALANPSGPEVGQETVTIINPTSNPVDLTGWVIADRTGRQGLPHQGLGAGETLRVTLTGAVRLSNQGETITLFDAAGAQVDQVSYKKEQAQREGWTILF